MLLVSQLKEHDEFWKIIGIEYSIIENNSTLTYTAIWFSANRSSKFILVIHCNNNKKKEADKFKEWTHVKLIKPLTNVTLTTRTSCFPLSGTPCNNVDITFGEIEQSANRVEFAGKQDFHKQSKSARWRSLAWIEFGYKLQWLNEPWHDALPINYTIEQPQRKSSIIGFRLTLRISP